MTSENHSSGNGDEPIAFVLSRGWLGDLIYGFSLPVVALPGRRIYSVRLHGSGISLPVEGAPTPIVGFHVTYHVAASAVRAAEERAVSRLKDWWDTFYEDTAGQLEIEIEETREFGGWFRRRSRSGFAYYHRE